MSVGYEVRDRVAIVTIDRPEKRNAMNMDVFDGLGEAARRAADDDEARAVMVRGAAGAFSSGIDVALLGEQVAEGVTEEFGQRLQSSFTAFEEVDKPVLAAISGPCFGAGLQLALACHVRAVAPDALLSVMEARWALVPDLGGTYRLPRLVGLGRATELALTARRVDAEEALRIGLAEIAVDDLDEAFGHAARLAAGPGALKRIPRLVRENLARDRAEALRAELHAQDECISGPDFSEAVGAAMESRDPEFSGR